MLNAAVTLRSDRMRYERAFPESGDALAKSPKIRKGMPMKTLTTLVLLAFGAASLSAALAPPASAQTYKPKEQTCDNKSTARDKVQRPDARCVNATSEIYTNERADKTLTNFFNANGHADKTTDVIRDKSGNLYGTVYDGVDRHGVPYRIVVGDGGRIAGSGSASGLGKGGSGGRGTSAR